MELAFINYSGSGKYSDTGNAVVPYRTLEAGGYHFSEQLPSHDTWWPVVQIWIPGVWHNGGDLQSLEHWVQVGPGGLDLHCRVRLPVDVGPARGLASARNQLLAVVRARRIAPSPSAIKRENPPGTIGTRQDRRPRGRVGGASTRPRGGVLPPVIARGRGARHRLRAGTICIGRPRRFAREKACTLSSFVRNHLSPKRLGFRWIAFFDVLKASRGCLIV
jgi:hypothetical protein